MNKVSDYHGFYLKTVVLLLADAFENIFLALLKDIIKQTIIHAIKNNKISSKYVIYVDANNLYALVMSQYLPYNGFKWLNQNKTDRFDVKSIGENSSDRYILEVDLQYPDNLHELQNKYPSTLEELKINYGILSKYCSDNANNYKIKTGNVNKFVPDLDNKSKYVLYYNSFLLYLLLGIKLVSIYRILKLKQSDWLKRQKKRYCRFF